MDGYDRCIDALHALRMTKEHLGSTAKEGEIADMLRAQAKIMQKANPYQAALMDLVAVAIADAGKPGSMRG